MNSTSFYFVILCLAAAVCCIESKSSATHRFQSIQGTVKIPSPSDCEIYAVGNSGTFTAIPTRDGSFSIRHVPEGIYRLDVVSTLFNFTQVVVEVTERSVHARNGDNLYEQIHYPLILQPNGPHLFVQERRPYDFFSLFKSGFFIFGIGGVFLLLTKCMDSDMMKEAQKEMQKMQREQTQAQEPPAPSQPARQGRSKKTKSS